MQNYRTQLGLAIYKYAPLGIPVRYDSHIGRTLLGHIKQQSISVGMGGMVLMRDLTAYKAFAGRLDSESVNEKFAILRDIANVFIVPEENLQSLIDDSYLARLDKEEMQVLIRLRQDERPTRVASAPQKKRR